MAYARDILSDERKRALFDEFGEVGLREGFDAEATRAVRQRGRAGAGAGFGFEDLFSAGARPRAAQRFRETLEDLFGGGIDELFGRGGGLPGRGQAQPGAAMAEPGPTRRARSRSVSRTLCRG